VAKLRIENGQAEEEETVDLGARERQQLLDAGEGKIDGEGQSQQQERGKQPTTGMVLAMGASGVGSNSVGKQLVGKRFQCRVGARFG